MILDDLIAFIDWIKAILVDLDIVHYKYLIKYDHWCISIFYNNGFECVIHNEDDISDYMYRFCELVGTAQIMLHCRIGNTYNTYRINQFNTHRQHYQHETLLKVNELAKEAFCDMLPQEFILLIARMINLPIRICKNRW